jgi:hypothetical protein
LSQNIVQWYHGHALLTMKALNRNQQSPWAGLMRGVRTVILYLLTALAPAGCMCNSAPAAVAQPQADLNTMTPATLCSSANAGSDHAPD